MSIVDFPTNHRVLHISDVEGDMAFFHRWVAMTAGIAYDAENQLILEDHVFFVFGGDAIDGPKDLALLQQFISVKDRYPTRVFLIAGNREIIKTRLKQELNSAHIAMMAHCSSEPSWYALPYPYIQYCTDQKADPHDPIHYLKWLLSHTCNAKQAFEAWRIELTEVGHLPISDQEVYEAFYAAVLPTGIIAQYLQRTDLVVRIGENIFMHGALTESSWDWMQSGETDAVNTWIHAVNHYYHQHLTQWNNTPPATTAQYHVAEQPLVKMSLSAPYNQGHTVITTSWLRAGRYQTPTQKQVNWLYRDGVYRIITGHQPWGDHPMLLVAPTQQQPLQVLMNDTRYSGISGRSPHAVQSLQIIKNSDKSSCAVFEVIRHTHAHIVQRCPALDANGQWMPEVRQSPEQFLGRYLQHPHPPHPCTRDHWLISGYQDHHYIISQKVDTVVHYDRLPEKTVIAHVEPLS